MMNCNNSVGHQSAQQRWVIWRGWCKHTELES